MSGTLEAAQSKGNRGHGVLAYGGNNTRGPVAVSSALSAHGGSGRMDFESETFIAHSLRGEGFDASEDGTGRGTPLVPTYTLAIRGRGDSHNLEYRTDGTANALLTPNGGRGGIGVGAVAFDTTQRAMGHAGSHTNGGGHQAVAYSTKLHNTTSNQAGKLYQEYKAGLDRNSPPPALLTTMQVRRLTPRECERLQGFPDDYTLIPHRGKPAADGPRYKALGNSWAVPCARWIGERIQAVEAIHAAQREAA